MSSQVLECPECGKRFRYERDAATYPERITCPECGKEQPGLDFSALVLCTKCNTKLSIPLDLIDDSNLTCPNCGAEISVGEDNLLTTIGDNFSTFDGQGEDRHQMFHRMLNDGDLFDKYRIIRLLGRGGMADVYLAEHLLLKQKCALKLMRSGLGSGDPVFVKRFMREARLAHKFNHPNIVKVFDAGSDSKTGYLYIAMEYVEGKTLSAMLKDGPFPEKELLQVLISMTRALKVLHEAGVVHRDIKPSNIMLTQDGLYKLMDLGIAKTESNQQGEVTLTMDQAAIGTPGYASPEQCQSAHLVDIRSDIYCLGATLYHLASGRLPFTGNTPLEIIIKVLQAKSEPLEKFRPDLSAQTLGIIESMMKKDPAERPADPEVLEDMIAGRVQFDSRKGLKSFLHFLSLPLKTLKVFLKLLRYTLLICGITMLGILAYFYIVNPDPADASPSANRPDLRKKKPPVDPTSRWRGNKDRRSVGTPPSMESGETVSRFPGGVEAAKSRSIEERIKHVNERLDELKKEAANSSKSGEKAWLNRKIEVRNKQLQRLKAQLAVRERAKHLDRSQFDAARMEEFKRRFAEYTGQHRDWGYNQKDIDFASWLLEELKTGKIDPNIGVVDSTYNEYSGPLLKCVMSGRIQCEAEIAQQLIKMGADTSGISVTPGKYREKALDVVISEGGCDTMSGCLLPYMQRQPIPEDQVTKILYLDHRIDEADREGNTALHYAARGGVKGLVELLLLLDSNVNARNNLGETPLFDAMKSGRQDIYDTLIEAGADPNIKDLGGKKATDMADIGRFQYAIKKGLLQDAGELLKKGISPDTRFSDDYTALQTACLQKNYPMVKLLLDNGADPNLGSTRRDREFYPLQLAFDKSKARNAKIFSLLLQKGANPNIAPIGYGGGITLLSHMCDHYSNVGPEEKDFLDALLSDPRTNLETQYPSSTGAPRVSILYSAISRQRPVWFVKMILDRISSFEQWDPTVVMAVLKDCPDDVIKAIIDKGANVNVPYTTYTFNRSDGTRTQKDTTALYEAVKKKRPNVVRMLLERGADADWKTPDGQTLRELIATMQIQEETTDSQAADAQTSVKPDAPQANPQTSRDISETAAKRGSIEERIGHVNERLKELKKELAYGTKSDKRAWLNKKINVRNEQLKRLRAQLSMRKRAKRPDRSQFDAARTDAFRQKFAEYARQNRYPGQSALSEKDFTLWLMNELESGKIDPNIEVIDGSGRKATLLRSILIGRRIDINQKHIERIVRQLIDLGVDTSSPVIMYTSSSSVQKALEILLTEGSCTAYDKCLLWQLKHPKIPTELVTKLLYLDYRVDESDELGNTALHYAALFGSKDIVELLLLLDADVNARNNLGETPLFNAMRTGKHEIYNLLIEAGADRGIQALGGKKASDMADIGRFQVAVRKGQLKDTEALLKKGIDPNTRFSDNYCTALQTACLQKNYQMVKLLLDRGADPNLKSEDNGLGDSWNTPLQLAYEKARDLKVFTLLLQKGADPNIGFNTSLSRMSMNMSFNRNPAPDEKDFLLALLDSPLTKFEDILAGRSVSILCLAILRRNPPWFIQLLFDKTSSFRQSDPVIAIAVMNNSPDSMIKALIGKGANVNASHTTYTFNRSDGTRIPKETTALYEAVKKKRPSVVKMLLEHGADADWKTPDGQTLRELIGTTQGETTDSQSAESRSSEKSTETMSSTPGAQTTRNTGVTAAKPGSIEWRIERVNLRLNELRTELADSTKSGEQEWLNKKIAARNEQLRQLKEQLAVRERAEHPDRSQFDADRIKAFKRRFTAHTRRYKDWGHHPADKELVNWMTNELESGKIDPNIVVIDSDGTYSGTLLKLVMSGRFPREYVEKIARLLVNLGADTSGILNTPVNPAGADAIKTVTELVLTEGGCDVHAGYLLNYMKLHPIPAELVTKLLYLDHRVDETDDRGNTALHYAVRSDLKDIVELLLLLDADVNVRNNRGETPLFDAKKRGKQEICELLTEAGADRSIKDLGGKRAAGSADITRFQVAVRKGRIKDAEELLKGGVDPNTRFSDDYTALQTACLQKNYLMVKLLLEQGADPNLRSKKKLGNPYPLQLAFEKARDPKIFALLLQKGADPNINQNMFMTQICRQRYNSGTNSDESKFLEALLADPRTRLETTLDGRTVSILYLAIPNSQPAWFMQQILSKITSFDQSDPVVAMAVAYDYPNYLIKELIDKGANVNMVYTINTWTKKDGTQGKKETTALFEAVKRRRLDLVKMLLDNGANADWKSPDGKSIRGLNTSKQIRALLK